jgi:hypothetical protein
MVKRGSKRAKRGQTGAIWGCELALAHCRSHNLAKTGGEAMKIFGTWWFLLSACIVFGMVTGIWWGMLATGPGQNFSDRAGAAESLFTALAFAGVLVTLWMQNYELTSQREDAIESSNQSNAQLEALNATATMQASQVLFQARSIELSGYVALLQSANDGRSLESDRARIMGIPHDARDRMLVPFDDKVKFLESKVASLTNHLTELLDAADKAKANEIPAT